MRCPFCRDLENRVVDSRLGKDGDAIRRRRHCEHCGRRFTTYERVEDALPMVVKKDGRREPFERGNLDAARLCLLFGREVVAADKDFDPLSYESLLVIDERVARQSFPESFEDVFEV